MNPVYLRVLIYPLLALLTLMPAAWANYGVSYADGVLYANLAVMAEVGVASVGSALGLGAVMFAFWGSGGRGAIMRTVIYILSPVAAFLAAGGSGFGVSITDATVAIHVETLIGAVFAGSGLSLGILRRWGVK